VIPLSDVDRSIFGREFRRRCEEYRQAREAYFGAEQGDPVAKRRLQLACAATALDPTPEQRALLDDEG